MGQTHADPVRKMWYKDEGLVRVYLRTLHGKFWKVVGEKIIVPTTCTFNSF